MSMFPHLGHGLGLRAPHFAPVLAGSARADWFEVISENFMIRGGRPLQILDRVRQIVPIVLHGVSMNLGGADPLQPGYLDDLEKLIDRYQPAWVSDHLCFGAFGGHFAHDLLPLPYTEEALLHVADRIDAVQTRLRRRILIENVSSYLSYKHSTMPEWEFLAAVAERADCGILLDVNNIYVSAVNHGFSPFRYLDHVPGHRVGQIHLAGHSSDGEMLIDTHDQPVPAQVWELYSEAVRRFGAVTTLVERDDNIPPFEEVAAEAEHARTIEAEVINGNAATL